MVIAVIGIVAAMSIPALKNMSKSDAVAAATRQMLDDVARARQFAISQRTTVYMVFLPNGFWTSTALTSAADVNAISNLLSKQFVGYNFISLRNVGDQPGVNHPRYLDEWRALPEGMFIPEWKFLLPTANSLRIYDPPPPLASTQWYDVYGFTYTNSLPFPRADTPSPSGLYTQLPYIAFNNLGQLVSDRDQEIIPLARGTVTEPLNKDKQPYRNFATTEEKPPGNSTNAFTLIVIDRLTGRAHVESQKISGN